MDYIRIGAISPPEGNRAAWARSLLLQAMDKDLSPKLVPAHEVVGFTANLPPHLAAWLKKAASAANLSPAQASAGLISALHETSSEDLDKTVSDPAPGDEWLAPINPELRGTAERALREIQAGKVPFVEAATGTGKGRLLLALALEAVRESKQTVISAPLPVVWQLMEELRTAFPDHNAKTALVLGRSNFVSPSSLSAWAESLPQPPEDLLAWIEGGGRPATEQTRALSDALGVELCWLIDDANHLLDDPLPGSLLMDNDPGDDDAEAEAVYQALKASASTGEIIFCSHHLLASHTRLHLLGTGGQLPEKIGLLLVDEAHLLEQAFATIFSQTLHIRSEIRQLGKTPGKGKASATKALEELGDSIANYAMNDRAPKQGGLTDYPLIEISLRKLQVSLEGFQPPKRDKEANRFANRLRSFVRYAVSGRGSLCPELTPVRTYPTLTTGQSNLEGVFKHLWEVSSAACLISATLYTDTSNCGTLIRWKLSVPKERAVYLPAVIPAWVREPVVLMGKPCPTPPNDSAEWHQELADRVKDIADQAAGGTLVLATSHATAKVLSELVGDHLGDRLLYQSPGTSAAGLARAFRSHRNRPVWIGVGAAWTGIDLANKSLPAEADNTLTDLVICRLPFGMNRSLPHFRRTKIAGMGVVVQEAVWVLRQGIGRLVRRRGTPRRQLWILDQRIEEKSSWMAQFRTILKGYKKEG
ncbi:TPA: helicase C-terminal domain-containing protein [Pseudomonas aeruginosa]|nr:hypothetical protein [Pseudomonas aeruginosa]EIU2863561.1 hypothetical protein [Pseudomonas aeruginosa]